MCAVGSGTQSVEWGTHPMLWATVIARLILKAYLTGVAPFDLATVIAQLILKAYLNGVFPFNQAAHPSELCHGAPLPLARALPDVIDHRCSL